MWTIHRLARWHPVLLAGLLACASDPQAGPSEERSASERLQAENADLERRLALASGREFYLLLEPERQRLSLMFQGAVLRDFPVLEMAVGRRRTLFVDWAPPGDWRSSVWQDGELEPQRRFKRKEIDPPDAPGELDSLAAVIPPTPEEAIRAPDGYLIHYREGRGLEIVGRDTTEAAGIWGRQGRGFEGWLERLGHALAPWGGLKVRLRLVLPVDQARALYRSLPEKSEFCITSTPR